MKNYGTFTWSVVYSRMEARDLNRKLKVYEIFAIKVMIYFARL